MGNTLKLGNGNWATKKDSLLAYNSENGNYKPLPFDFTRASSATVVNKDGLIETVGSGEPRIDFSNDGKGTLLLEPQRSNLVTYSEEFSQSSWAKTSVSITSNSILSPDGSLSASTITEDSSLNNHRISVNGLVVSGTHTISVFAKANDRNWLIIRNAANNAWFDISNGVVGTVQSGTGSIEAYQNGWYKCSITMSSLSTPAVGIADNNGSYSYQGNGNGSLYIWGAQAEQGSYATSYIPTQGSAVTRLAETCTGAGNEQVINSTEGVLYAEISALTDDGAFRMISISDGTNDNRVRINYTTTSNQIAARVVDAGVTQADFTHSLTDSNEFVKLAIYYKNNDCAFWVNGIKVGTDPSATMPSGLDTLNLNGGSGTNPFYGNVKDIKLYNTALTDSELAALTKI